MGRGCILRSCNCTLTRNVRAWIDCKQLRVATSTKVYLLLCVCVSHSFLHLISRMRRIFFAGMSSLRYSHPTAERISCIPCKGTGIAIGHLGVYLKCFSVSAYFFFHSVPFTLFAAHFFAPLFLFHFYWFRNVGLNHVLIQIGIANSSLSEHTERIPGIIYSIFLFNWLRVFVCAAVVFAFLLPFFRSIIDLFLLFYMCQRATTFVLRWTQKHSVFSTHSCTHFRWQRCVDSDKESKTNSLTRLLTRCCESMRRRQWMS